VVCNTHEGDYKFIHTVSWKNPKGIDNLGDLSEDRIILKFMLKKWREVVDWIQLAQWRSGNLLKTCYELSSPHDVTIQTTRTGTFTAVKASNPAFHVHVQMNSGIQIQMTENLPHDHDTLSCTVL